MKTCLLCDKAAFRKGLCMGHSSAAWRAAHPGYDAARRRDYRRRYPEKARAANKKWRDANPTYGKVSGARWRLLNKEHIKARSAAYRLAHPDATKQWRKNNKEHAKDLDRRKKLKRWRATGSHTQRETKLLFVRQQGKCAICREAFGDYHEDHIIPLALGGSDFISNIQLLCPRCNQRKSATDPIVFMQSLGFLL